MSVSKGLRFEIFKRDGFICQYCGRTPPEVVLHLDHVVPKVEGGGDEEENLITACKDCNLGKSGKPMDRIKAPLNLNTAEREEKLEQLKAFAELKMKEMEFDTQQTMVALEMWAKMEGQDPSSDTFDYQLEHERSVRMFLKKLPLYEILDAIEITDSKCQRVGHLKFKYFCAVCWNKIKDREAVNNGDENGADRIVSEGL